MILRSGVPGPPVSIQGVKIKQHEKERYQPPHEKYIPFLNYYTDPDRYTRCEILRDFSIYFSF